jgi:hypothetical protein
MKFKDESFPIKNEKFSIEYRIDFRFRIFILKSLLKLMFYNKKI